MARVSFRVLISGCHHPFAKAMTGLSQKMGRTWQKRYLLSKLRSPLLGRMVSGEVIGAPYTSPRKFEVESEMMEPDIR